MSAQDDAATHASRAKTQAKHATKNAAQATKLSAVDAVETAIDVTEDVAEGAAHIASEAAEAVGSAAVKTSKKVHIRVLTAMSGDTAQGFAATTVSLWAAGIAWNKFGAALAKRGKVIR